MRQRHLECREGSTQRDSASLDLGDREARDINDDPLEPYSSTGETNSNVQRRSGPMKPAAWRVQKSDAESRPLPTSHPTSGAAARSDRPTRRYPEEARSAVREEVRHGLGDTGRGAIAIDCQIRLASGSRQATLPIP